MRPMTLAASFGNVAAFDAPDGAGAAHPLNL
jgi:hypothetical protein